jgi:hypothetical protein
MYIYIFAYTYIHKLKSRDSTVGIATGYGLDDKTIGVRVPVGQKCSFLLVIQTESGAQPASYRNGTGVFFPGVKATGA